MLVRISLVSSQSFSFLVKVSTSEKTETKILQVKSNSFPIKIQNLYHKTYNIWIRDPRDLTDSKTEKPFTPYPWINWVMIPRILINWLIEGFAWSLASHMLLYGRNCSKTFTRWKIPNLWEILKTTKFKERNCRHFNYHWIDHVFLSCCILVLEWIYTLQLPECQGTFYLKANLAKWLIACLQTKSL